MPFDGYEGHKKESHAHGFRLLKRGDPDGRFWCPAMSDAPLVHAPCGYAELAAAIKRRVDVPVIGVGRIEPEEADALIREGKLDFVAMARKLLADPELPVKLRAGRPRDVRPCIYCYTCVGQIFLNQSSCCVVNPASGREAELEIRPSESPRTPPGE